MYDWSWKIEHLLTDMIDEVDKKYGSEVEIFVMDFDSNEFDTELNYDDGDEFRAEKLTRIYIEYKGETVYLDKTYGYLDKTYGSDMYELDGLVPIGYMEVFSGALSIVSKYLNKIEEVLRVNGYYEQN